jgi:hypothetical protein
MERRRQDGWTPDRCRRDAAYWRANHGTLPARALRVVETEIDEADACELGSQAALEQIRRDCAAERR